LPDDEDWKLFQNAVFNLEEDFLKKKLPENALKINVTKSST